VKTLCDRCGERLATVFLTSIIDGGEPRQEGLCNVCGDLKTVDRELNEHFAKWRADAWKHFALRLLGIGLVVAGLVALLVLLLRKW
jgi:protein-arginine kinase activator protein McsA